MFRTLFIYLLFSVRYGKKKLFSIVGKIFNCVVRLLDLHLYLFMLLVRNSLIFKRCFLKDILELRLSFPPILYKL